MVALDTVQAANTATATHTAAGRPFVAVFTGGTSGIGMYGVRALAATHGAAGAEASRGLRVYIVGRRGAEALVAECHTLCPFGTFEVVAAQDLGLLRDVDRVCAAITAAETAAAAREGHAPKIDLLVETQGVLSFGSERQDTSEGLDHPTALVYYGRARVIDQLLPLLTAATPDGAVGHVALVLNPFLEGTIVADDLSLRRPGHFTMRRRGAHGGVFTTFYLEALARRNPRTLALVHYYPGFVPTTDLARTSGLPHWTQGLWSWVVSPLMRLFRIAVPPDACGQHVAFLATTACYPACNTAAPDTAPPAAPTGSSKDSLAALAPIRGADGVIGSGAYRVGAAGDAMSSKPQTDAYRAEGMVETIYAHTQAAFAAIAAGRAFAE